MKEVIFIGNRLNVLEELLKQKDIAFKKIFVLKDSVLHKNITKSSLPFDVFEINKTDKNKIINYLKTDPFDLLISNGCPFIIPVDEIKKTNPCALFINTHPTYLPHLKGATPLNGVFYLGYNFIGATTHYMDSGIDTGNIIFQEKIDVTPDLDQGLIYFLSFKLESIVFSKAYKRLVSNEFIYEGEKQKEKGSYFNREESIFKIDIFSDTNEMIIKKIKSLGMTTHPNILKLNSTVYKIHDAEVIINNFLLELFTSSKPGTVLYEYSDKILLKTKDGIIKMSIIL